jgi:hypothetical protein
VGDRKAISGYCNKKWRGLDARQETKGILAVVLHPRPLAIEPTLWSSTRKSKRIHIRREAYGNWILVGTFATLYYAIYIYVL